MFHNRCFAQTLRRNQLRDNLVESYLQTLIKRESEKGRKADKGAFAADNALNEYLEMKNYVIGRFDEERKSTRFKESVAAQGRLNSTIVGKLNSLNRQIAIEERLLYNDFYTKFSKTSSSVNACRNFSL